MSHENISLIKEMMRDAENKSNLYSPGNYWKYYEKNILKQIKNNDLSIAIPCFLVSGKTRIKKVAEK